MTFRILPLLLAASLVLVSPVHAQEDDFIHPELRWNTIETQHFLVHFHDGAERTARQVSCIAESIYVPVTSIYHYRPDQKVSFVIRDHDDYSNGASYFFDNRIVLWAPALDFELRGIHPWLWNVVTHEFTHMVQIQASLKFGRRIPAFYLQWLGYEAERRPDVLYGYPNVLVSYPYSGFVVPSWFAEGVAQFNNPDLKFDSWDSHRDMILRMYMLAGKPLSWEEMAVFGKTSLGNESSYNAGFSLVAFIVDTYGLNRLEGISRKLGAPFRLTIDGAIEAELGITGQALYRQWVDSMTVRYRRMSEHIGPVREGKIVEKEGFGNTFPKYSPDGSKLAYVSNKGADYFGVSSVYLRERIDSVAVEMVDRVRSTISFSPDGSTLYYSRGTRDNPHWSLYDDLYRYRIAENEETRLTHGLRAAYPSLSADGSSIVCVTNRDGTSNLTVVDADGKNARPLTHFVSGEQVYAPAWSPDGKTVAFGLSTGHNQSLALLDMASKSVRVLPLGGDSRDATFSRDGKWIYFAWDRNGIFNLYRYERSSGIVGQVTNVLGGAFRPTVAPDGRVAYVSYCETGFTIAEMDTLIVTPVDTIPAMAMTHTPTPVAVCVPQERDTTRAYRSVFTSISLIPVLRVDNYNEHASGLDVIKPGLYFSSGEVLDRMSLFGGAAINRKWERDLFLIFEYRGHLPVLGALGLEPVASVELYNISRKADATADVFIDRQYHFPAIVTYDLFEVDGYLRQNLFSEFDVLRAGYTLSRYSASVAIDNSQLAATTGGVIKKWDTRDVYLIGNTLSLRWDGKMIASTVDREINPIGRTISLRYSYEMNKYNPDLQYDYSSGIPVPLYKRINFHRMELLWNEHIALPFGHHTFSLGVRGGTIQGARADTIFNFYVGGFTGMRGYPFYAIEGNHVGQISGAYRFPLWTNIDTRFLQFYFTKLFGSVFADVGNAWDGPVPQYGRWRKDVGFEFRLEAFSFYAFPTRIFFSGAYGLDRFTRSINGMTITYGNEWRFYLGVLFGFELTDVGTSASRFLEGL